jgi:aspartyl protease family protein
MSYRKRRYHLSRYGNNQLKISASVGGINRGAFGRVSLLVDTGSSFTILPVRVLSELGYDLSNPVRRISITTGRGVTPPLPVINVRWLNCVGQLSENFEVIAYRIPPNLQVNGLLGMDFLCRHHAIISTAEAQINFRESLS